jgi:Na+/melibiose symporter-like transporter
MVTAIPTAIIVGLFLDILHHHQLLETPLQILWWCGGIFMLAGIIGAMDIACHHPIPDIPVSPAKHESLLGTFSGPLHDAQFLWFAGFVGTITFAVSFMGQFATLYLLDKLSASNLQTQIILLAVPNLAQLIVLPAWGRAADRMGKRPIMAIAALGLVPVGFGWCFMNGGAIWLGYFLTAAGAALYTGVEVANLNMTLEMSGTDDRHGAAASSYVAVNLFIVNIAGCLGGLSAGLIAQALQNWTWNIGILGLAPIGFYEVLFALSGVARLLAVVIFLPKLREPRAKRAHEALWFMTTNIYNNVFSLIAAPFVKKE